MQDFYITKYALSKGIFKLSLDVYTSEQDSNNCYATSKDNKHFYAIGRDAFTEFSDALEKAEKMRVSKLKSLQKHIQKLNNLNFNVI